MLTIPQYKHERLERREHHHDYWRGFLASSSAPGDSPVRRTLTQEYLFYETGPGDFHVAVVLPIIEHGIRVEFSMLGRRRRDNLAWFRRRAHEIESQLDASPPLDWREANEPFNRQCQIGRTFAEFDPRDVRTRPEQYTILGEQLRLFRSTFGPMIKDLLAQQGV
jgi:hypothetical protein